MSLGRHLLFLAVLVGGALGLSGRVAYLQLHASSELLRREGQDRFLRTAHVPVHRGMITDRRGEPLAVSTPVRSVWVNPELLARAGVRLRGRLTELLALSSGDLNARLRERAAQRFLYLRRGISPALATRVAALKLPGVFVGEEYRRYYPVGAVAAHVTGFSDVDEAGQEGAELVYDEWLRGTPGSKKVVRDRLGRAVERVGRIEAARPGRNLALSLDLRLQHEAYVQLERAVSRHRARGGSLVLADVATGEILALVNQPSFNPNNRRSLRPDHFRNRAVTDLFEPGSTLKPFTVLSALLSGDYFSSTPVDTTPGEMRLAGHRISDIRNFGLLELRSVLIKSSNVGAARVALALPTELLWKGLRAAGLGSISETGFPGEVAGRLSPIEEWTPLHQATTAYGYGVSLSALQLAQAYAVLANDGVRVPLTFRRRTRPLPGQRVFPAAEVRQLRSMLEAATAPGGSGRRAAVPGYRVAGKTGTVHKAEAGGYAEHRYLSLFAGFAPAGAPRLVLVVMIDEPGAGEYFGGLVAAPVFAAVMGNALRLLGIRPEARPAPGVLYAGLPFSLVEPPLEGSPEARMEAAP